METSNEQIDLGEFLNDFLSWQKVSKIFTVKNMTLVFRFQFSVSMKTLKRSNDYLIQLVVSSTDNSKFSKRELIRQVTIQNYSKAASKESNSREDGKRE